MRGIECFFEDPSVQQICFFAYKQGQLDCQFDSLNKSYQNLLQNDKLQIKVQQASSSLSFQFLQQPFQSSQNSVKLKTANKKRRIKKYIQKTKSQLNHYLNNKKKQLINLASNQNKKQQKNLNLSHSNRSKYQIFDQKSKEFFVDEVKKRGISQVSKYYNISVNNLCRWRRSCVRRKGAGRKINDMQLQQQLIDWLKQQNIDSNNISRKQIQQKAKMLSKQQTFKASKGWFERFFSRNQHLFKQKIKKTFLSSTKKQQILNKQQEIYQSEEDQAAGNVDTI